MPTANIYRRVFERISPFAFERSFQHWLAQVVTALGAQMILIDGKQLRGCYERHQDQSALSLVSAGASEYRLFPGQVKVEDKSNKITAILALLELLDIAGCIISIDAMLLKHVLTVLAIQYLQTL